MSAIAPADNQVTPRIDRVVVCLAGSGYRAALFHLGALRRLNELGLLSQVQEFHAVSGGSLVLGALASRWTKMDEDSRGRILEFHHHVIEPIERFVRRRMRLRPALSSHTRPRNWGKLLNGQFTETDRLIELVERRLVGRKRLRDLADSGAQFHWHATNLRTGGKWDFSETRVGEPMVGYRWPDRVTIAEAIVASMIDPAELPPLVLRSKPEEFDGGTEEATTLKLRRVALLTDGSIQDPLAMDTTIGTAGTLLVCDGGSMVLPEPNYADWLGNRMLRTIAIQQQRGVELRRRWLVDAIRGGQVEGTYISLAAHHGDYGLPDSTGYSMRVAEKIWHMAGAMEPVKQDMVAMLSNHGYTIADAAVRRLLSHRIRHLAPMRLPYPDAGEDQTISIRMESYLPTDQRFGRAA